MDIKFMVEIFNIGADLQDKMYNNECYEKDVKERKCHCEMLKRNL